MKRTLLLLPLIVFQFQVLAQTYDEKIQWVRVHYNEIESKPEKLTEGNWIDKPYDDLAPVAWYKYWEDSAGQIVKVQKSTGEEGYSSIERYYYHHGQLFFYYSENAEPEYSDGATFYNMDEARVYFFDNQIFEYLYKTKDAFDLRDMSQIPNKKAQWDTKIQVEILKASNDIIEVITSEE